MADAALVIRIVSDVKSGVDGMRQVKSEAGGFKGAMQKAQPAAKAVAVGLVAAGAAAAKYASDLQQSTGAVESVFKDHAAQVQASAQQAAGAVGLSTNQYQEMASVIGAQLKNMGTPMDALAGQTDDLVKLGADLAATYGGTTSDAVAALSSLLRGETDPIEKYGVSIKAADVAAQKAKMGLSGLTGEADKQATAQATLALLAAQSADAQGQFAREAGSAAGSAQIAQANVENAAAAFGTALLPVVGAAATALGEFAKWAQENAPLVQGLAVAIGVLAAGVLAYNAITKAVAIAQGIATAAQWAFNAALLANPVTWIVLGIIALIAVIVLLVANWDTVKATAIAVWEAITGAIQTFWGWLVGWGEDVVAWFAGVWNTWVEANRRVWEIIIGAITTYLDQLKETILGIVNWFVTTWNRIIEANRRVWEAVGAAVRNAISTAQDILQGLLDKVNTIVGAIRDGLVGAWESVTGTVTGFVDGVIGGLQRVIDMARDAGRQIRDALSAAAGNVFGGFGGIFGFAAPPSELTAADTTPLLAPRGVWLSNAPSRASGVATVINNNITINGAIDPRSTADQVRQILNGDARLRGAVSLGGAIV